MMNRAQRRASSKGRRVAAGAAIAAASLMSTYMAAVRPATSYASASGRVHTRSAPLIPTCADADVTVTTGAELRSAVQASAQASADDSVICVSGTINLTGTGGRIFIPDTSTLTIVGAGTGATILAPMDDSGIFASYQGNDNADDTLIFSNLTLQDGLALRGGAISVRTDPIYRVSDALVIHDVDFINNRVRDGGPSSHGGAVYANRLRSISITNSTFTASAAEGAGGAVFVKDVGGDFIVHDSTFTGSTSEARGGAIYAHTFSGLMSVADSAFSQSSAKGEGGAIFVKGTVSAGALTSDGNVFYDNHATTPVTFGLSGIGGAIFGWDLTDLTSADDSFAGNSSVGTGGAVRVTNIRDSVDIAGSYFADNTTVVYGGALYVSQGPSVTISDSTFARNVVTLMGGGGAWPAGGAVGVATNDPVSVTGTTFSDNVSGGIGGGLALWTNGVEIADSTFSGNSAVAGGAVAALVIGGRTPVVTLSNSTLVDNTATDVTTGMTGYYGGGAILGYGAGFSLDFATVTGNHADDSVGPDSGVGGAIRVVFGTADDTLTITNSIVAGNTADGSGADIAVSDPRVRTVIDYAALTDPSSVVTAGPRSILHAIYGPLASLLLGPLQDNGGATYTRLPAAGSPVIDAGNPAWAPPPQYDQRGAGFPRKLGDIVDLGAVEAGAAPGPGPGPGPNPGPTPVHPPSAPREVSAAAADASAVVRWAAPSSPGSFPVSSYQVTASPGGQGCVTSTLMCTVSDLVNGTAYTFTVKALNGAGWSAASAPSDPVTPRAAPQPSISIMITGTRSARTVEITGSTRGIEPGSRVTPWIRKPSTAKAQAGRPQEIDEQGTFTWTRRVRPDVTLRAYVTWGDIRSNVVRLPAGRAH